MSSNVTECKLNQQTVRMSTWPGLCYKEKCERWHKFISSLHLLFSRLKWVLVLVVGVLPWLFSCLFVQRASIKEFKWEKRYKEDIKLDKLVFNVHWKCVVSYKCDTILLDTCMTPQLVLVSAFLKTSIYMQEVTSFQSNCAHIDFPPWYSIENGSPSEASMFQCS